MVAFLTVNKNGMGWGVFDALFMINISIHILTTSVENVSCPRDDHLFLRIPFNLQLKKVTYLQHQILMIFSFLNKNLFTMFKLEQGRAKISRIVNNFFFFSNLLNAILNCFLAAENFL